jgi:hypothetical protein
MISGELGKTSRILQFAWPFKSLDGFHYQQIHRYRLILPSDRESRTGSRSVVSARVGGGTDNSNCMGGFPHEQAAKQRHLTPTWFLLLDTLVVRPTFQIFVFRDETTDYRNYSTKKCPPPSLDPTTKPL